ncbi:MAG TPA: hypothetical protein VNG51_08545 [Ktedonobacteraceae bacterium]|nr:hypothetical protein [Ktedonobacteraceae bacterium]
MTTGTLVVGIAATGPAATADLKPGDAIVRSSGSSFLAHALWFISFGCLQY